MKDKKFRCSKKDILQRCRRNAMGFAFYEDIMELRKINPSLTVLFTVLIILLIITATMMVFLGNNDHPLVHLHSLTLAFLGGCLGLFALALYLKLREKNNTLAAVSQALQELNQNLEQTVADRTLELSSQKSHLQQLFEKSPDAMAMLANDYTILNVNPAFEKLFGWNRTEITGQKIDQLLTTPDMRDELQLLRDELAQSNTVHS